MSSASLREDPERDDTSFDDRLRVLAVCAVNGHGGPIKSLGTIVDQLGDRAAVTLASQAPRLGLSLLDRTAVALAEIPRPQGWRTGEAAWRLVRHGWSKRGSIDVVHANGLTEVAIAVPLMLISRLPIVVWIHNFERPAVFRLVEPILRWTGRLTWTGVSVVAAEQVPWSDVTLVHNPIAAPTNNPTPLPATDRPVIAYAAGTDRPYKGFDFLPDIVEAQTAVDVDWHLFTAPPHSSDDDRCRRAWDRLLEGRSGRVEIRGRVPDASEIYRSATIVIAPSRQESFNRVIVEALAHGVPVVASDIAAHRALADECEAVLTYPLGEPAAAAARIVEVLNDGRYAARQSAARAFARSFEPERIATQMYEIWQRAAESSNA